MTIYRDNEVAFGGMKVGGIRISHMSNIDGTLVMALTASKAKRAPYKVLPLKSPPASKPTTGGATTPAIVPSETAGEAGAPADGADVETVVALLREALQGASDMDALREMWGSNKEPLRLLKNHAPDAYDEIVRLKEMLVAEM